MGILVFDKKINTVQQILNLLESVIQTSKPIIIICDDVEGEALATLVVNKLRGGLKIAAIKAPGFGERKKSILEDIAILTGGQFISEDLGHRLEKIKLGDLGRAKRVIITKDETTIVKGYGKKQEIDGRCYQIRSQ